MADRAVVQAVIDEIPPRTWRVWAWTNGALEPNLEVDKNDIRSIVGAVVDALDALGHFKTPEEGRKIVSDAIVNLDRITAPWGT
jgi:hypothetical protein